jgi:hypothetical protein
MPAGDQPRFLRVTLVAVDEEGEEYLSEFALWRTSDGWGGRYGPPNRAATHELTALAAASLAAISRRSLLMTPLAVAARAVDRSTRRARRAVGRPTRRSPQPTPEP